MFEARDRLKVLHEAVKLLHLLLTGLLHHPLPQVDHPVEREFVTAKLLFPGEAATADLAGERFELVMHGLDVPFHGHSVPELLVTDVALAD